MVEEVAAGIGLNMFELAKRYDRWVPRRTETVEFISRHTVRRKVHVDIDLSQLGDLSDEYRWPRWHGRLVLPIAVLKRSRMHTSFEIHDETGASLIRLNRRQERDLVFSATVSIARNALGGLALEPETRTKLSELIYGDADVKSLRHGSDQERVICDNTMAFNAIQYFRDMYFLTVPLDLEKSKSRSITYIYFGRVPTIPFERPRRSLHDLGAVVVPAECPGAGDCASYHFEMIAPEETTISDAVLRFTPLRAGSDPEFARDNDCLDTRAHVRAAIGQELSESMFKATIRIRSGGLAKYAVMSSVFTLTILLAGTVMTLASQGFRFERLDLDSGVTLLLLVPGVVGSVIAGPSPHTVTAELVFPTRLLLWTTSVCSFLVAAAVAVAAAGIFNAVIWILASVVTFVCTALLSYQYLGLVAEETRNRSGQESL